MAKAKFPGKPPKTSQITRLRISSNANGSSSDSSRFAAQQAAYGLKLFHQHFASDDEEDDDFLGFEKTDAGFKPHFQSGCLHTERFRRDRSELQHKLEPSEPTLESAVKVPPPLVVSDPHHTPSFSKLSVKVPNERTSSVTQPSSASPCGSLKSVGESQPDRKVVDKPSKHTQAPLRNVALSKTLGPTDDHKKGSSEDSERCRKSRPVIARKLQPPAAVENAEQEKNRIKREIARYTTIMTAEVVDSKLATDEKKKSKKHRSSHKDGDKAEKLRDKIQQLLRKQWESRLQLVDVKAEPRLPLETKTTSPEGRGSSLSVSSSSEEDELFYKRRRMSSNSSSSSSARKSKIILRKARLQLNQKLLKQLRQPSRLQQLVEPKPPSIEPAPTVPSSSSSILRPAQLVLQTSTNPVPRIPTPRTVPVKEPKAQPKVPTPPPIKSSYIPKAGETTVSNPLGCAFVMGPSDSKGLPGTVVCGVCGAVRRYSFILQARKFGTFSCEPCRKFISRILRARVPVKCSSGSGRCIHPPVLRWNSACPPEDRPANGEVMTARCKACWLKLALTGFQMRESDHDDLRKLLPVSMQDGIPLAAERPTTLHWAPNRGQMIRMKPNTSSIPNVPALPTSVATAPAKVKSKSVASKKALNLSQSPSSQQTNKDETTDDCVLRDEATLRVSNKKLKTREKSGSGGGGVPINNGSSTTESQSGPRVKHVCRSAVAARAQPRATFHSEDSARSQPNQSNAPCDCCSLSDPSSTKANPLESLVTANGSDTVNPTIKNSRSTTDRKNSLSSPAMPLTTSQGERSRVTFHDDVKLGPNHRVGLLNPAVRAWQQQDHGRTKKYQFRCMTSGSAGRKPAKTQPKGVIFADLWEHYDADRVWDQGFAICCSRLGVTSTLCFLCGSAGRNELVSCSSCCETFHPFCVADSAPLSNSVASDCHHWDKEVVAGRVQDNAVELHVKERGETGISVLASPSSPWICLNCVMCQICQSSSGDRMVCSSCSLAYHWCCLGPAHPSSKRKRRIKWQCFACSPVKDKFCPLCFECHTSRQMKMECNCCGTWVHAQCEDLPEEDFRLLCSASDVEFVCSLCCPDKNWVKALRRHANQVYVEILTKLIGLDIISSDHIDAISYKVSQNEYLNCSEFSADIRQLFEQLNVNQLDLLSIMPWVKPTELPITPRSRVSVTAKVDYEEKSDGRLCALCHGRGEGPATAEGRLLYCGNDIWAHVNCALWSNEVFEEVDGALQNVFDALARGSGSRCTHCHTKGATVNCCVRGCPVSLHFPCALQSEPKVTLLEGKRLICHQHAKEQSSRNLVIHPPSFEVARCVYVDLGAESKRIKPCAPRDIRVVIGSLTITSIGHLRSDVSGGATRLTPVGFECQRRFWSVKDPRKMASYTLRTIYVPSSSDKKDSETNVTVSHEEDDVIMAESGLNLAELDTQDDRELIHMVLEDANFEQELEGEPNASLNVGTPNELRDSGFYSDGRSAGEVSPSPTEDNALEAWLADPEHAVFFLDSALLASLDIENPQPNLPKTAGHSGTSTDDVRHHHQTGNNYPQSPELNSPPKRNLRNRRLSYSQWRRMRLQNRTNKRTMDLKSAVPALERPSSLDWNGNEAEWDSAANTNGNLVASIKVSPLSPTLKTINKEETWMPRRNPPPGNILQLDGAGDSSDTEPERSVVVKLENSDEPVKCKRCRRSYRTLQSFNKHVESCVEMLSISSSSDNESESDDDVARPVKPKQEPVEEKKPVDPSDPIPILLQPKEEPMEVSPILEEPEKEPIQVPVIHSSSSSSSQSKANKSPDACKLTPTPAASKTHPVAKSRVQQRRKFRPNVSSIPARTLAIRQANPGGNARFQMPTPSPIPPSYQVTLQSPTPPAAPLLYVQTRPELSAAHPALQCSFLSQSPLAVPQQHYIIMPPSIDQTFIQTTNCTVPTLTSSGITLTQHSASPMVQYLGAVPSNLLSALGIMTTGLGVANYTTTVPSLSALMQGQPLQVPWETPVSNQIVILPQPPLLSFNLPSMSLQSQPTPTVTTTITTTHSSSSPPATTAAAVTSATTTACSTIELPASVAVDKQIVEETKQHIDAENDSICGKIVEPKSTASLADRVDDNPVAAIETRPPADNQTKTNSDTENVPPVQEPDMSTKTQLLDDEEMACEIAPPVNSSEDRLSEMEGKPPKPTYSYRSAMAGVHGAKKTPRIIGTVGSDARIDRPSLVQQLKVVAHPCSPDQSTRTFHLKATTDDGADQLSIATQDAVESLACQLTRDTPPTTTNADGPSPSDISDVFATPPASSEPPILPSDIDAEPVSWPVIDSTLEADEPKPTEEKAKKKEAHILYELVSDDGFYAQSESLSTVWQKLLDAVQDARLAFKMEPLYNGCLKSLDERNVHLTGLHHHAVINLLEQLPNANQLADYTFRYQARQDRQSAEAFNTGSSYGCVRAAPFENRLPYDMFGWLASQYRPRPPLSTIRSDPDSAQPPARRVTNFELLPMTVRFKHLRQVAKHSVGVFRSHIHGRGLFCKRDIECGEMVVEYAGQVIRSVLCDKREKEYEAKGMGCYMFRIDEQTVVDATVHGNAARFINHSCEPNCYSRIVDIFGKKHIIIFALRRIQRGEELTYDYKFPLEDTKIPCTCGSRKCRKYLN